MSRDARFVAVHRGGTLDQARHRQLAGWAADCAEHALPLFEAQCPNDGRVRLAIEGARAWSRGEISLGAARAAAVAAHATARDVPDGAARKAARAAGHAVATAHMADHSTRAAGYAVGAVRLAAGPDGAEAAAERERAWQRERLPEGIRDLVLSAQERRPGIA